MSLPRWRRMAGFWKRPAPVEYDRVTELVLRNQALRAEWFRRVAVGFAAVDPRTPRAATQAVDHFRRRLRRADLWLFAHNLRRQGFGTSVTKRLTLSAARFAVRTGRIRLISGGRS